MKNDATLKIRVRTSDVEMWRGLAAAAEMSLSEWIRGCCNEKATPGFNLKAASHPVSECASRGCNTPHVPTAPKTGKTCTHGVEKNFHPLLAMRGSG